MALAESAPETPVAPRRRRAARAGHLQPLTHPTPTAPRPAGRRRGRAAPEFTIVHQLPGRVRLRVPRLKDHAALAQELVSTLRAQAGIHDVRATPACASVVVTYDPQQVSLVEIAEWIARTEPSITPRAPAASPPSLTPLVAGTAALGLSLLGAPAALAAGLLAVSAVPIFARAGTDLVAERQLTADALDATAVTVLALRGDLLAAALSASLIAGGEYIRALTSRRSRGALAGLLSASGRSAWVVRGDRKERVPADSLAPGDVVVVYPGDLIVVDGIVTQGRALVDQKVLTGESTPVLKQPGDTVYASTAVTDGKLYVRTEQVGTATRASRIVQILEGAPVHDTRMANYARRFADRLVLPTLLVAGGAYAVTRNVTHAVSIIVFDFATGVRVSAPTTVLASMTAAARRDVLIKGGRALEQLACMDTLVFDKTGTLTAGTPLVTEVRAFGAGFGEAGVLALAAAAERRLVHPAAQAIVREAEARGLVIPERGDSHYTVGMGMQAEIDGHTVLVGSQRYLARHGVAVPAVARATADEAGRRGASTVFVACDGLAIGAVAYADLPRPEARLVVQGLHARGVRHLVMVTGDNAQVARAVAEQIGLDQVEADVFPERKAEIVRHLQSQGKVVGVIGDGINDSPALAYADVSLSLKAGTDVARETADVVLHGDLLGVLEALDTARESMRLIRQNLTIVGVPNAAGLILATFGLVNPVAATAINNGSNVAAALNGLRPLIPPAFAFGRTPQRPKL